MSKLKIAVVGGGHLGRIHAKLLKQLDDVELIGVVEPSAEGRRLVSKQVGAECFPELGSVLDKIDAAIVAAPTVHHREVADELIKAQVDLLVEKPLAARLSDAEWITRQADQNGLILQVGHVERFNPAFAETLRHAHHPRFISSVRSGPFSFRCTDVGVVMDLMIHDIDLVLASVDSEVASVDAVGVSVLTNHEDIADARITFENGCVANLHASRVALNADRRMTMVSQHQQLAIDFSSGTTTITRHPHEVEDWETLSPSQRESRKERLFDDLLTVNTIEAAEANAILEEQKEFVGCLKTRKVPQVSGLVACQAITIAEAICDCIHRRWEYSVERTRVATIPIPTRALDSTPRRRAG